jgi:hypothetical protein
LPLPFKGDWTPKARKYLIRSVMFHLVSYIWLEVKLMQV